MKKLNTISSAVIFMTLSFQAPAATLTAKIDHLKNDQGVILAQIFQGQEAYQKGQAAQSMMKPAQKGEFKLEFSGLKTGDYVIRLFHDENNNGDMDKNAFGLPIEGYGFSNQAVGHMGPPKYQDMVVTIESDGAEVVTQVKMVY